MNERIALIARRCMELASARRTYAMVLSFGEDGGRFWHKLQIAEYALYKAIHYGE